MSQPYDLIVIGAGMAGAGRVAELADLGLDTAHVEWGERGILVTDHLQSPTNPAVWAAGDSADTDGMPLTPVAVFESQGRRLQHDQGHQRDPRLRRDPHRGLHDP